MQAAVADAEFRGGVGERGVADIGVAEAFRAADAPDALMAQIMQIRHGPGDGLHIEASHDRQAAGQRRVAQREHRHLRIVLQQLHARVVHLKIDQQQRIHVAGGDPVLENRHFGVTPDGETQQNRVIVLFQLGSQAGQQLHHVRFDGKQLCFLTRQNHADTARIRPGQRLGGTVRLPAEVACDLQHFGAGGLGNAGLVVQRVGDGAAGDTGGLGDIENGDLVLLTSHGISFPCFACRKLHEFGKAFNERG